MTFDELLAGLAIIATLLMVVLLLLDAVLP